MGETARLESLALTIARKVHKTHPKVSEEIADCLTQVGAGASPLRSIGVEPTPTDRDSHLSLVRLEEPADVPPPVLQEAERAQLDRFVREWQMGKKLIAQGLRPPTSLLLTGAPGVGKTHTVRYLASLLGLPLIQLDLSTAISSYLGKTGHNLRTVLDYARRQPSLLFLDEFDAVAKKRDDPGDVGELKRLVNVLLTELESWPAGGILAAATNHPELLDRAIWRRFDTALEVSLPGVAERRQLLERHLRQAGVDMKGKVDVLGCLAELTSGLSAADVCKLSDRVLRRVVLDEANPVRAAFEELPRMATASFAKNRGEFCRVAKRALGDSVSTRDLADWLGIVPSTVHFHLKRKKDDLS